MRARHFVLIAAALLASAPLFAQQTGPAQQAQKAPSAPPAPAAKPSTDILGGVVNKGTFEIGVVGSNLDGDAARFQRYRDLRNGPAADVFRFTRDEGRLFVRAGADHAGRRDQRYFVDLARPGKVKASFVWDQIPLRFSNDAASLYRNQGGGVLGIDDSIQKGIENNQFTLASAVARSTGIGLSNRRDTASFNLLYSATHELDLKVNLRTFTRQGNQPWGASFGFSNDIEVPLPLDSRTTDVNTGFEWGNARGNFSLAYLGSWYDNHIPTLVWDNPIKFTDSTYGTAYIAGDGTSQGRMAIFPSNNTHAVAASGNFKLPARSNASAYLSVGSMNQNQPLLPFTTNSAIPQIPLERATAEAEARTVAANLGFTSRPNRYVWLNARYRYNDFTDRTPGFNGEDYVRFDQVLEEIGGEREPFNMRRQNFNVDASFTPIGSTALKVGYGHARTNRTSRIFEDTVENTFRTSIDTTGNQYVSLRAVYEHNNRTGEGFDEPALIGAGEQPGMRHFDVADRNRDRFTAIATLTPISQLGINFSAGAGKDDYGDSLFGLRDNTNRLYSLGFDLVPTDAVTLSLDYGLERFSALQNSRNASPGPQFTDPTRNWNIDSDDRTRSVNGSLDLLHVFPATDVRIGYDYSRSRSTYVYGLAANSTLPAPEQLPPVVTELQRATVDAQRFLTKKVAVGFTYWFDKYSVQDFALNSPAVAGRVVPGALFLGYLYRPYTANTGWFKVTYLW